MEALVVQSSILPSSHLHRSSLMPSAKGTARLPDSKSNARTVHLHLRPHPRLPSAFLDIAGQSQDEGGIALKKRAGELAPDLKGACIFLIGMMGSGKDSVGKALAEALGYHFFDSDKLIQDAAGGTSGDEEEEGYRDAETEVLKQLSCMGRLVVATGGGVVVRPMNWSYLRHGVTVWLDAPLETLVERVTMDTTGSQPSVESSGYSEAMSKFSNILKERSPFYADADATVSLEQLAVRSGYSGVACLTPTMVAMEVLEEINNLIQYRKKKNAVFRS